MKVVVLNGSPKGKNSITIQSVEYLKKHFKEDNFQIINVGQLIRKFEKIDELKTVVEAIKESDLLLFSYPVYSAVAPYQLHKFIDLMKANVGEGGLKDKLATQLTTSKHFYDFTAHKYVEENCYDLGMKTLQGLSADMDDLLSEAGREQLISFWKFVRYSFKNSLFVQKESNSKKQNFEYQISEKIGDKKKQYDTLILTNCKDEDINLKNMIEDYRSLYPYETRVININDYKFTGGCLGCLNCASDGKCIYKDDFESFLREEVQGADAVIYAATIENHFIGSDFKLTFDRQFCDGHRTVTMGMPVGYILSGPYSKESNLINIIEGRSEVSQHFMLGVATDESHSNEGVKDELRKLAIKTAYSLENKIKLPQNFLGVGGAKIFRDLIYITGGLMREDHKFYKKHGFYDFPQKKVGERLKMKFVGYLLSLPSVKKKIGGSMQEIVVKPYKEAIEK